MSTLSDSTASPFRYAGAQEAKDHHFLMQRYKQLGGAAHPYEANELARRINMLIKVYESRLADAAMLDLLNEEQVLEVTIQARGISHTCYLVGGAAVEVIDTIRSDSQKALELAASNLANAKLENAERAEQGEFDETGAYIARVSYQEAILKPVSLVESRAQVIARVRPLAEGDPASEVGQAWLRDTERALTVAHRNHVGETDEEWINRVATERLAVREAGVAKVLAAHAAQQPAPSAGKRRRRRKNRKG